MSETPKLTNRELEILRLYTEGNTSKEIAKILGISPHTVDAHKHNMILKFNAKNIIVLVVKALQQGLI